MEGAFWFIFVIRRRDLVRVKTFFKETGMRKTFFGIAASLALFVSFAGGMTACSEAKISDGQDEGSAGFGGPGGDFARGGPGGFSGGFGQGVEIVDDGSTTDYVDSTVASASGFVAEDLYENFVADGTVSISFDGTVWTSDFSGVTDSDVSIKAVENSSDDESARGVEIQYKGEGKIKYVLSGNFSGTVFIKNKNADAAVVLDNVEITSDGGAGPALRFSSEKRTFIVVPEGTVNSICDTRVLNQDGTMYDDKKGSIYSKGALIFTGESSVTSGGTLNVVNKGYKHAVYSKDYVRITGLDLNVSVEGTSGRDCIRALNAVIVDGGKISLNGNGTIEDDESVGIKVEGEDADDDDKTVEYTAGAGFVIINGGEISINTVAKGITAHWKSAESVIGNAEYTETKNKSLLSGNLLSGTDASIPNPYVEINGGIINIKTTGEPYEGQTDDDPSCSPEGIEAKGNLTINAGTITLSCTDDALNAGGNIIVNGGAVYAYSSKNDAVDANGENGITINGGTVVALGLSVPECAFDCDEKPFTVNGGLLVGLGSDNYTAPSNGNQSVVVLPGSKCGDAGTTMALVDSDGKAVFVYTLPSGVGSTVVLSSPNIEAGKTYSVKTGVSVSGGTRFHNLYTALPTVSGGTESVTGISTDTGNTVYIDSDVAGAFGGFGGAGGFNGNRMAGGMDGTEGFPADRRGGRGGGKMEMPEGFVPGQMGKNRGGFDRK